MVKGDHEFDVERVLERRRLIRAEIAEIDMFLSLCEKLGVPYKGHASSIAPPCSRALQQKISPSTGG